MAYYVPNAVLSIENTVSNKTNANTHAGCISVGEDAYDDHISKLYITYQKAVR